MAKLTPLGRLLPVERATVRVGRPQSSDIIYAIEDGTFLISVTEDRARFAPSTAVGVIN